MASRQQRPTSGPGGRPPFSGGAAHRPYPAPPARPCKDWLPRNRRPDKTAALSASLHTPLQLEFVVTPAESAEAESLLLRKQLGGGSRWRMWLVLAVVVVFALGCMYFQFRTVFPPHYRPWAYAGMAVLVAVIMISRPRQERRRDNLTVRWEISPTELVLASDLGRASPTSSQDTSGSTQDIEFQSKDTPPSASPAHAEFETIRPSPQLP